MDVSTIIATIKSQALVGNTGAVDDNDRILRYLNMGYYLVYARIAQIYPSYFEKYYVMQITDGVGLYPFPVYKLISVTGDNGQQLRPRSSSCLERGDTDLDQTGVPTSYEEIMNGITVYPRATILVRLRYAPTPVPLTADTTEINIQIPVMYHEVLVWAALWSMAYDERDKLVGSELQFTQAAYESRLESLLMYIQNLKPAKSRRVKSW